MLFDEDLFVYETFFCEAYWERAELKSLELINWLLVNQSVDNTN